MVLALRTADGRVNVSADENNHWLRSAAGVWRKSTSPLPEGTSFSDWVIMPDELDDVETLDEMSASTMLQEARASSSRSR